MGRGSNTLPSDVSSDSDSDDNYVCDVCGMCGGGDWIACDSCNIWYHQECVDVAGEKLSGCVKILRHNCLFIFLFYIVYFQ